VSLVDSAIDSVMPYFPLSEHFFILASANFVKIENLFGLAKIQTSYVYHHLLMMVVLMIDTTSRNSEDDYLM